MLFKRVSADNNVSYRIDYHNVADLGLLKEIPRRVLTEEPGG